MRNRGGWREWADNALFLRPADQVSLSVLTLVILVAWGLPLLDGGRAPTRWVTYERAPRREVRLVVDLNTASSAELTLLPGIGPTLAGRIVDWRRAHGAFPDVTHLQRVKGIGPQTLARARHLLTATPGPHSESD